MGSSKAAKSRSTGTRVAGGHRGDLVEAVDDAFPPRSSQVLRRGRSTAFVGPGHELLESLEGRAVKRGVGLQVGGAQGVGAGGGIGGSALGGHRRVGKIDVDDPSVGATGALHHVVGPPGQADDGEAVKGTDACMNPNGREFHRWTTFKSTLSSASEPGNGPCLTSIRRVFWFQELDFMPLEHEDEVVGPKHHLAEFAPLLREDADARPAALANENLMAGRQRGQLVGRHVIVGHRRAPGLPLKQDDLQGPGIVREVRLGVALGGGIADTVGFAHVLEFLLRFHERGELGKFVEVAAHVDRHDAAIVGRPKVLDALHILFRDQGRHRSVLPCHPSRLRVQGLGRRCPAQGGSSDPYAQRPRRPARRPGDAEGRFCFAIDLIRGTPHMPRRCEAVARHHRDWIFPGQRGE